MTGGERKNDMKCVICGKDTNGFYDDAPKIPVCFEHYDDGTLAEYLKKTRNVDTQNRWPATIVVLAVMGLCGVIIAVTWLERMP
jgi:hypothetical protein